MFKKEGIKESLMLTGAGFFFAIVLPYIEPNRTYVLRLGGISTEYIGWGAMVLGILYFAWSLVKGKNIEEKKNQPTQEE